MRGDFSRIRLNRGKGYTAVLEQQGRVALDADANEQCFIDEYLRTTETTDVIGDYGAPAGEAGFGITLNAAGNGLEIGRGRYYVGGLLCENEGTVAFGSQPYLLSQSQNDAALLERLKESGGQSVLQIWLEVWQRLVTPLEDPCLREPALGLADTTARLQTLWHVYGELAQAPQQGTGQPPGVSPCCQVMYENPMFFLLPGEMTASTSGSAADCGCQPVATAGYQGVENQLYRVEIHQGGDASTATFKWSRENGSVQMGVTDINGQTVTLSSVGQDANLGLQPEQWVELTDDTNAFGHPVNQPGTLYKIQTPPQPGDPTVTMYDAVTTVDQARHPRLRRWDQPGTAGSANGIPLQAGTPIPLENGIEVCFEAGRHYQAGDYWTIPARTATGTIEWPPCDSNGNAYQPPQSPPVYRAPLACIHFTKTQLTHLQSPFTIDDCRLKFNPLTDLAAPSIPPALHVQNVSWANDDVTTFDQLIANGLQVELDQAPTGPISGANFEVTVEAPTALAQFEGEGTAVLGFRGGPPVTIIREPVVIDSSITVSGSTIDWQLPLQGAPPLQRLTLAELNTLISRAAALGEFARARVRLLGDKIFAAGASGPLYLDGRAFGAAAVRSDGQTPRIELQLPSGDGVRASDLEGWFYLAPVLEISSMTIDFSAVTVVVDANNNVTGVEATSGGATQQVTPTVTLILNYPPLTATTLSLTVTGATGAGTVVTVPASLQGAAAQTEFQFQVAVNSNPGANTTLSFTITATLPSVIGITRGQSVDFSVTGVQPPPPTNPIPIRPPIRPIFPTG